MKLKKQKPDTDAMVRHFVNMAKGNAEQSVQTRPRGLGVTSQPMTYRMVPRPVIKAVTPTAQAVYQAEAAIKTRDEKAKSIRRPHVKKRKTGNYHMPGLD